MKKEKNLWFKSKLYGWGWCPSSCQGFITILLSLVVFEFFLVKIMQKENVFLNIVAIIVDFLVLLLICYKKGEKPRWRWGK